MLPDTLSSIEISLEEVCREAEGAFEIRVSSGRRLRSSTWAKKVRASSWLMVD